MTRWLWICRDWVLIAALLLGVVLGFIWELVRMCFRGLVDGD